MAFRVWADLGNTFAADPFVAAAFALTKVLRFSYLPFHLGTCASPTLYEEPKAALDVLQVRCFRVRVPHPTSLTVFDFVYRRFHRFVASYFLCVIRRLNCSSPSDL